MSDLHCPYCSAKVTIRGTVGYRCEEFALDEETVPRPVNLQIDLATATVCDDWGLVDGTCPTHGSVRIGVARPSPVWLDARHHAVQAVLPEDAYTVEEPPWPINPLDPGVSALALATLASHPKETREFGEMLCRLLAWGARDQGPEGCRAWLRAVSGLDIVQHHGLGEYLESCLWCGVSLVSRKADEGREA